MKTREVFLYSLFLVTVIAGCKKGFDANDVAQFFTAVNNSDYKLVEKYIKKYDNIINVSFNVMGIEGNALIASFGLKDVKMAKLLIKEGINLEYYGSDGIRVLHAAVQSGSINDVKLLLEAGADISAKDNLGMTVYHYALYNPSIEMLDLLYENNKNIDEPDNDNTTPLLAIMSDRREGLDNITMWFLENGADFDKVIKLVPDMVPSYIYENRNDIVKYLIKNAPSYRNYIDFEGNTVSHFCVGMENEEVFNYLIDNKYYSNNENQKGETPLKMAERIGRNDLSDKIREYLSNNQ